MARWNQTPEQRFFAKVEPEPNTGCWLWLGATNGPGYGTIRWGRDHHEAMAHRVSYELARGPIPSDAELDHLCRTRCCVNPDHLEPVTSRENQRRSPYTLAGINIAKWHCPRGHAYDPENTYVRTTGKRQCRACHRDDERRAYRRMTRA